MSAIIKTLKTKTDDIEKNVYPKTVLEAVVDPDTGKTLDVLLDENMPEGAVYTSDESEPETNVDAVTSASYVSYSNTTSNLEATNVQDAIDELKESIGSGSGETVNIVDNLESTSADSALSANQGRVLKESIDEVNTYLQRSKNLLKIYVDESAFSELGSSIIVNDDKSITHSGTHTLTTAYWYIGRVYLKANTEYILSGCPAGGSLSTYALKVETASHAFSSEWVADTGEGVRFSVEEEGYYRVHIMLKPDVNYDGITYYPMIREASVEDDTYEPYYEDTMKIVNNALVHGDVVDNLESTATDLPLSANQGRVTGERIDTIESTLITGINVTGQDFNELDYGTFIGIGTNMTNAPLVNTSVSYLIQQICVSGRILQYAKAVNWGDGELLWFRQMRVITDGAKYWDNWYQVGLQSDIETLKSQTRKCIPYVHMIGTNIMYISASFKYGSRGIIEFKGSNSSGLSIYSFIHFDEVNTPKIKITNWGSTQLEIVEGSISYVKNATPDITDIKFALKGVGQWASMDIEFPVRTVSMSASSSEI